MVWRKPSQTRSRLVLLVGPLANRRPLPAVLVHRYNPGGRRSNELAAVEAAVEKFTANCPSENYLNEAEARQASRQAILQRTANNIVASGCVVSQVLSGVVYYLSCCCCCLEFHCCPQLVVSCLSLAAVF